MDIGKEFRTSGDQFCPWDKRLYFPQTAQKPDNRIDGKGNIILSGEGSSRIFVYGEWDDHFLECDVLTPNNLLDNVSINCRSRHHEKGKFAGYHGIFGFDDNEDRYGKKEWPHGVYSPRIKNGKRFQDGKGFAVGKKVKLRMEIQTLDSGHVEVKGFYDKYDGKGLQPAFFYIDDGSLFDDKTLSSGDKKTLQEAGLSYDDIKEPYTLPGTMIWIRANHHDDSDPIRMANPRIHGIQISNINIGAL